MTSGVSASRNKTSAGVLGYRRSATGLEVLLVHPGGPFWRNKDDGAWSIPKGEVEAGDDAQSTALREFREELGPAASVGTLAPLGEIRQMAGKRVLAFCGRAEFDPAELSSNVFEIEWPPRSGRRQTFPEVDRAAWFDPTTAKLKILAGQDALIDRLIEEIGA